jgi:hypothetical protein
VAGFLAQGMTLASNFGNNGNVSVFLRVQDYNVFLCPLVQDLEDQD